MEQTDRHTLWHFGILTEPKNIVQMKVTNQMWLDVNILYGHLQDFLWTMMKHVKCVCDSNLIVTNYSCRLMLYLSKKYHLPIAAEFHYIKLLSISLPYLCLQFNSNRVCNLYSIEKSIWLFEIRILIFLFIKWARKEF